ncbi:MAG TPA: ABC transporter permease [Blastocatellia bacterium]|nr:ABC transporter permease [Blastocatellia bacterium]
MIDDLRFGLRILFKRPAFTIIALMTFALGIAANTIVFSGVYSLFLQGLPYPNAERLAVVSQADKNGVESGFSFPDFNDWKQQNTVFEQMAAFRNVAMNLTENDPVERLSGSLVSREFMPMLGGGPAVGRSFLPEDFQPGGAKTIILSHSFWQRRFGGDTGVIGKPLVLSEEIFTVIGVAPQGFQYPFRADFWTPLDASENPQSLQDRSATVFGIIALLRPKITEAAAANELAVLAGRPGGEARTGRQELMMRVTPLRDSLPSIGKYRTPVLILQLAVIFVLLIACTNLANMLLARNTDRTREFTIRLALGAGRARLIRQLLAESVLLGVLGSILGLVLAAWGLDALKSIISWRMPGAPEVEINTPVLLITLVVSLLTSLGFGLVPAIIASRQDLNEFLKSGSGSTTSDRKRRRLSRILVCSEISLAVMLLVAAGLMVRTFLNLTYEDPGFNPARAMALSLSLPPSRYSDYEKIASYYDALLREVKALPGVESAGGVTYLPLVGYNPGTAFVVEGQSSLSKEAMPRADFQPVTPGYFEAMGIPLLDGRGFKDSDAGPVPEAIVINSVLAKKFWPGEASLGKRLLVQPLTGRPIPAVVVGVVGDVKQFGLHTEPRPEIYLPSYRPSMTVIIRAIDTGDYFSPIRKIVERLDNSQAAFSLRTMEQLVADSIDRRRTFAMLLGVLAAVAALMAAMGIYGVISYLVSQRTREIGIRMAIGAEPREIMRSVVKQGVWLAVIGLGGGLAASLVLARAMRSLLYGVGAIDPPVIISMTLVIIALSIAASYIPARKASKVDPTLALRCE